MKLLVEAACGALWGLFIPRFNFFLKYERQRTARAAPEVQDGSLKPQGVLIMGKYVLGWFMGVPVFVLVIVYFLFN